MTTVVAIVKFVVRAFRVVVGRRGSGLSLRFVVVVSTREMNKKFDTLMTKIEFWLVLVC